MSDMVTLDLDVLRRLLNLTAPAAAEGREPDSFTGRYIIARNSNRDVFAGVLESRCGNEATLTNARRLWYWKGVATLSQVAEEGLKCPAECKVPRAVSRVSMLAVVEILLCSEQGRASIEAVPVWSD